jgi:hypothetical protein
MGSQENEMGGNVEAKPRYNGRFLGSNLNNRSNNTLGNISKAVDSTQSCSPKVHSYSSRKKK